MKRGRASLPPEAARFRQRLLLVLLAVVTGCTGAALYLARRSIAAAEEQSLAREFQAALATLHQVQELRQVALEERGRALARKARIRAALEDGALDLLYLSARDELRDAMAPPAATTPGRTVFTLRARFYRFLDAGGQVLAAPQNEGACGGLTTREENQLALPRLVDRTQTGYLAGDPGGHGISELVATPIYSSETGEPIAALVLGFEPVRLGREGTGVPGFTSGIWLGQQLDLPSFSPAARAALLDVLQRHAAMPDAGPSSARLHLPVDGEPHLVFYKQLNAGSPFPVAYEVCLFPLADMLARQQRAAWKILGAGTVLLLAGFIASHQLASRFSKPVAVLAHDSREQRAHRQRAEAALESTSAELERAARFSADASHQLKTPVTVLRAGLEEILARGAIPAQEVDEVSALIHQTYRLSTLIEDLLLLSRLDAGQLKINFVDVDLGRLIDASLDDLSASPDGFDLAIEADCPRPLLIAGEKRYIAMILQNLLENARKYNRAGGRIRLAARAEAASVLVTIGNTTRRPIPASAQPHIFERFHRGAMGENVPGYGIGLNLARELTRLHDGDLRLLRSDETWTEFEIRFRSPRPPDSRAA